MTTIMQKLGHKVRAIPLVSLYEELAFPLPNAIVVADLLGRIGPSFIEKTFGYSQLSTVLPAHWSDDDYVLRTQTLNAARELITITKGERNGSS